MIHEAEACRNTQFTFQPLFPEFRIVTMLTQPRGKIIFPEVPSKLVEGNSEESKVHRDLVFSEVPEAAERQFTFIPQTSWMFNRQPRKTMSRISITHLSGNQNISYPTSLFPAFNRRNTRITSTFSMKSVDNIRISTSLSMLFR